MTLVGVALPEQRADVLDLIDAEFMVSRGRVGSVRNSFPGLLESEGEAVVAEDGAGRPAAVAVWRPFSWWDGERRWRAAMVGLVVTRPDRRGEGLGSAVLLGVRQRLAEHGVEVAVLWARRHEFYLRLGWRAADPGVRAAVAGGSGDAPPAAEQVTPELARDLLAIHRAHVPQRVERSVDAYRAVPPPAEQVVAYVAGDGYALVGRRGRDAFVLEAVGSRAAFPALWQAISTDAGDIVVNERRGSPMQRWLAAEQGLRFEAQKLALWLPLAADAERAPLGDWHVGWLDRI